VKNGHVDMPIAYHVWDAIRHYQSRQTSCRIEISFRRRSRMICFTRSLRRQLYHCKRFRSYVVATGGTDIVNILLFKYRISLSHLTFIIETVELLMKSCAKFDLSFVNIQCATACSVENVNFKV